MWQLNGVTCQHSYPAAGARAGKMPGCLLAGILLLAGSERKIGKGNMNKNKPGIVLILGVLVIMVLVTGIAVGRFFKSAEGAGLREDEQQAGKEEENLQQDGIQAEEDVQQDKQQTKGEETAGEKEEQRAEEEATEGHDKQQTDSPFDMSNPVPDETYTAIVSYQARKVMESGNGLSKAEITVTMPQLTMDSVTAGIINKQLFDYYRSAFENGISGGEQDARFQEESSESAGEDFHYEYTYEEGYQITLLNERYLSVLANGYVYAGGAHGLPFRTPLIFDLETGEQVKGKSLFAVSQQQFGEIKINAYKELIEQSEKGIYWEDALSLVEKSIDFDGGYYLTEDGVTFYYDPYALAPYAAGYVEVTVPYEKLPLVNSAE